MKNELTGNVRGDASAWFRRGALPEIPRKGSIARMMLDAWSEGRI